MLFKIQGQGYPIYAKPLYTGSFCVVIIGHLISLQTQLIQCTWLCAGCAEGNFSLPHPDWAVLSLSQPGLLAVSGVIQWLPWPQGGHGSPFAGQSSLHTHLLHSEQVLAQPQLPSGCCFLCWAFWGYKHSDWRLFLLCGWLLWWRPGWE